MFHFHYIFTEQKKMKYKSFYDLPDYLYDLRSPFNIQ